MKLASVASRSFIILFFFLSRNCVWQDWLHLRFFRLIFCSKAFTKLTVTDLEDVLLALHFVWLSYPLPDEQIPVKQYL